MTTETLKKEFIPKFLTVGEPKFYRFLLLYALNKLIELEKGDYKGTSPELELLNYYERFLVLYRREGEDIYLDLARVFRKSANKIYRVMLKKELTETDNRFLNLVK